jgi:acetamidase/formamidase
MQCPHDEAHWLAGSVMHRRGLAGGRIGRSHRLSEAAQGEFKYTLGPYCAPVLEVAPGDRIAVETLDAFGGRIRSESDRPSEILTLPFGNPQNGPIRIAGAKKGDVLAVYVERIVPRGEQPRGTTCLIHELGGLVGTDLTAVLNDPLPEKVRKVDVDTDWVYWSDRLRLPYAPFIGTIGLSPQVDSISSLVPACHGGNMDLPETRPGHVIYLPVRVKGAYLFLGDVHAAQGDGELSGNAIEHASETTIVVDLIRDWPIRWPRIESERRIMSVGSARPMEDATRIAYRDLVQWMAEDYRFDRLEAYMLLSQCGRVRLGNMVNPNYTVSAGIEKEYLHASL